MLTYFHLSFLGTIFIGIIPLSVCFQSPQFRINTDLCFHIRSVTYDQRCIGRSSSCRFRNHMRVFDGAGDRSTNSSQVDANRVAIDNSYQRPQIIPFDFARDDIVPEKLREEIAKYKNAADNNSPIVKVNPKTRETKPITRSQSDIVRDILQPTGYDNDDIYDEIDGTEKDDWIPIQVSDDESPIVKFLRDVYIGSPYDSNGKKQARYVVRSITLISILIGIIFTGIWYAFPGKFISVRADRNFAERYNNVYIDPDDLLKNDIDNSPDWEYFQQDPPKLKGSELLVSPPATFDEIPKKALSSNIDAETLDL